MKSLQAFLPINWLNPRFPFRWWGYHTAMKAMKFFRRKSNIACIEYIMEGKGTVLKPAERFFIRKKGMCIFFILMMIQHYYSDLKDPWTKIWINVKGTLIENLALFIWAVGGLSHWKYGCFIWFYGNVGADETARTWTGHTVGWIALILHRMIQKMSKQNHPAFKIPEEAPVT